MVNGQQATGVPMAEGKMAARGSQVWATMRRLGVVVGAGLSLFLGAGAMTAQADSGWGVINAGYSTANQPKSSAASGPSFDLRPRLVEVQGQWPGPAETAPPVPSLATQTAAQSTDVPSTLPAVVETTPQGEPAALSARGAFTLGPQDRIKVIVFQEPELSGEFVVQSTGRVSLPLLGEMQAQGMSARELEVSITAELKRRQFLNDPKVAVDVMNARPFYILGEVQKPGEYPYLSGLTVLNAVATAGGFTALADQTNVFIKRAGSADWTPLPLEGGLQVGPGDTVRIEKGAFYILGEVQKAGEYPYTPGMSVMRAVAVAQGYTPRAERGKVMITRKGEVRQREVPMNPDVPIQPGDTIVIPERWF